MVRRSGNAKQSPRALKHAAETARSGLPRSLASTAPKSQSRKIQADDGSHGHQDERDSEGDHPKLGTVPRHEPAGDYGGHEQDKARDPEHLFLRTDDRPGLPAIDVRT